MALHPGGIAISPIGSRIDAVLAAWCSDSQLTPTLFSARHPFPRVFNGCNRKELDRYLQSGGGMCLSNMPDTRTLYGGRRCGNGYLEDGEECDCGEEEVRCRGREGMWEWKNVPWFQITKLETVQLEMSQSQHFLPAWPSETPTNKMWKVSLQYGPFSQILPV